MDLGAVHWAHKTPQELRQGLGTVDLSHFLPKTHTQILKRVITSGNWLPQSLGSYYLDKELQVIHKSNTKK